MPAYTVDELEMMTRETFELLCRELQATGRVPQQHAFGRPPIPLHKQVLAFVWFIASAVIFPYRRYGRERPGTGKKKPLRNPYMEHAVPSENFQRENGTTFSEVHFPVERIKKSCSVSNPAEISRIS